MRRKDLLFTSALLILITCTLTIIFVMQVFPAGQTSIQLSSTGSIITTEGIAAYSNFQCTTPQTSIDWGQIEKGGSNNIIIYLRNEGDSPLTLSLISSGWNPTSAANYLTLTWDYNNQPIDPNDVTQIVLTLNVSPDIQEINNFGVNVLIIGNS